MCCLLFIFGSVLFHIHDFFDFVHTSFWFFLYIILALKWLGRSMMALLLKSYLPLINFMFRLFTILCFWVHVFLFCFILFVFLFYLWVILYLLFHYIDFFSENNGNLTINSDTHNTSRMVGGGDCARRPRGRPYIPLFSSSLLIIVVSVIILLSGFVASIGC